MSEIIVGTITGGVTLLVCIINNIFQNKQTRNLIEYRLKELEKKQDKHNSVIERVFAVEKVEEILEEKIKVVNHRLEDLEREGR